jgi:hypothetical protein
MVKGGQSLRASRPDAARSDTAGAVESGCGNRRAVGGQQSLAESATIEIMDTQAVSLGSAAAPWRPCRRKDMRGATQGDTARQTLLFSRLFCDYDRVKTARSAA